MKSIFALLLIAGILLAAQCKPAIASENGMRAHAHEQDWWRKNFGQFLSARSLSDVQWLNHALPQSTDGRTPLLPQLDTLDPFRLHLADKPMQTTASGQFQVE